MTFKSLVNILFIFTAVLSSIDVSAVESQLQADCRSIKKSYDEKIESLLRKYDKQFGDSVQRQNRPELHCGSKDEAVYILHGFIGTPEEMSRISNSLKRAGYTVLSDIIPGHGAGADAANAFKETYWQSFVTQNVGLLRSVYQKIHFVGFSTGALLIHNYLFENRTNFSARSVVLYSPFYKPAQAFVDVLNACLNDIIPTFSIKKIYGLTRFREVEVALIKPENYQTYLPLLAAEEVVGLGRKVSAKLERKIRIKINSPVLVFLSTSDGLVQYTDSVDLVNNSFLEPEFVIYDSAEVPHHLMVSEVSPVAREVGQLSFRFIKSFGRE